MTEIKHMQNVRNLQIAAINIITTFFLFTSGTRAEAPRTASELEAQDITAKITALENKANSEELLNYWPSAITLWKAAAEDSTRNPRPNQEKIGYILYRLALALFSNGSYIDAEKTIRQSIELGLGNNEKPNTELALKYLLYGNIFYKTDRLKEAEELFKKAIGITAENRDSYSMLLSLNAVHNISSVYTQQGRLAEAEHGYLEIIRISKMFAKFDNTLLGNTMLNLGNLYRKIGKIADAKRYYDMALEIQKQRGGNSIIAGEFQEAVGSFDLENGSLEKSNAMINQALTELSKKGDQQSTLYASLLRRLGNIKYAQLKYTEAARLYSAAEEINERFIPRHTDTAFLLLESALNQVAQGKFKEAQQYSKRAIEIIFQSVIKESPFVEDGNRGNLMNRFKEPLDSIFGFSNLKQGAEISLYTRLNRQGLLTEIEQRQSLLMNGDMAQREQLERLQGLIQHLSNVSLPIERRKELQEERDRLQAELYRRLPELKLSPVTIPEVAKALPANGLLIEFQRFQPYDFTKPRANRWGQPQYLALILFPSGTIRVINLGAAEPLEAAIHQALLASQQNNSDATALWQVVSQRLLNPLAPHISSSRQLFLSPDAELNRVPFAALPTPQNPDIPLGVALQLRLLTTGRDLIRLQQPSSPGSWPRVLANPSFDRRSQSALFAASAATGALRAQQRSAEITDKRWQPLPASEQEGRQVGALLGVAPITGEAATTLQLQRLAGPRVLHVATHGFFLLDQTSKQDQGLALLGSGTPALQGLSQEDPQLRSGLVLAGANDPGKDPNDDGYLTAAEALMLNLKGTELVVLSACSTGQGDVRTGEGVYGLQRSLTVAGARSTLLSLWKVDDAATAEFMTRFYKRLKAGEGRSDALTSTQQEFRNGIEGKPEWKQPYYWAAWQLVGDWRPIKGL